MPEHHDMTEKERQAKLALARKRYGQPFITEVKVQRVTEPSLMLWHIRERARPATNVTPIAKVSK